MKVCNFFVGGGWAHEIVLKSCKRILDTGGGYIKIVLKDCKQICDTALEWLKTANGDSCAGQVVTKDVAASMELAWEE